MTQNFIPCERQQELLLPPSLTDWLPPDHLVWFVIDAVERIDLSRFYARHRDDGWGRAAFEPKMMVALVLYAYATGIRSTRVIERRLVEDVAFRVIAANHRIDHSTIARFRQRHEQALSQLFTEVLRLCADAGLVHARVVAIDGTKVEADASGAKNVSDEQLRAFARKVFEEAAETDAREDELYGDRGFGLPEHLADPKARREWLDRHIGNATRINTTDPDSAVQKTPKGYIQGYNAQAVVTPEQIVIAADVTADNNDVGQFVPLLEQATANLDHAAVDEPITTAIADSGYLSAANVATGVVPDKLIAPSSSRLLADAVADHDPDDGNEMWPQDRSERVEDPLRQDVIEAYVGHHVTATEAAEILGEKIAQIYLLAYRYRRLGPLGLPRRLVAAPPRPPNARKQMIERFARPDALELYGLRAITVEPVFGQNKAGRGFRRFMRRGKSACSSEFRLQMATHNLLKLWRDFVRNTAPAAAPSW